MIAAIADTHATIWYLFSDPRLSGTASDFIEATIATGNHIGVSAISIAEMVYLVEKNRIPANALTDLRTAMSDPRAVVLQVPLDEAVALKMTEIARHGTSRHPRPSRSDHRGDRTAFEGCLY